MRDRPRELGNVMLGFRVVSQYWYMYILFLLLPFCSFSYLISLNPDIANRHQIHYEFLAAVQKCVCLQRRFKRQEIQ